MQSGNRLEPRHPLGIPARGRILQAQGDLDKALADSSEAIRLGPKAAGAYITRAGHSCQGRSDKALADYTEAIRLATKSAFLTLPGPVFIEAQGDCDKALRTAKRRFGSTRSRVTGLAH